MFVPYDRETKWNSLHLGVFIYKNNLLSTPTFVMYQAILKTVFSTNMFCKRIVPYRCLFTIKITKF